MPSISLVIRHTTSSRRLHSNEGRQIRPKRWQQQQKGVKFIDIVYFRGDKRGGTAAKNYPSLSSSSSSRIKGIRRRRSWSKSQEEVAGFSASRWEDKSDNPSRKGCTFKVFFSWSSFRGNWCGTHNGECKSAKATKERRRLALRKFSLKLDAHRIMDTLSLLPLKNVTFFVQEYQAWLARRIIYGKNRAGGKTEISIDGDGCN